MELRKCECGGEAEISNEVRWFRIWFFGYCWACKKESSSSCNYDEAVNAWNEGKVE